VNPLKLSLAKDTKPRDWIITSCETVRQVHPLELVVVLGRLMDINSLIHS